MSRTQQDQFIDDEEEETCPLCVEEFDLSDRNFRPCPCGYQICQFCYNNIKTTMNGLCPACRRPYDDKNISWRKISPEEMANYKAEQSQRQKKTQAAKQKEAQKREADTLSRKHLAGLRVVQKNLVYVTGLQPTTREDKLLETLRGDQYFGQYGKIVKIVVSKAKDTSHHQQSVGVYVTFARKEDAETCITAVDGSENGDRTLRAQYGTTKYCSAYLRNETCNNRNCMFLHEPGDEGDRFTRQDLSSMNAGSSNNASSSLQPPQSQPHAPAQQAPIAAASQMARQESSEGSNSPKPDAPALPSTASWGSKAAQLIQDRRTSRTTASSEASPAVSHTAPARNASEESIPEPETAQQETTADDTALRTSSSNTPQPPPQPQSNPAVMSDLERALLTVVNTDWTYNFSAPHLSEADLKFALKLPRLIDPNGGAKRRAVKERERQRQETEDQIRAQATSLQTIPTADTEDNPESGSLQLGGEPEEQHNMLGRSQHAIGPPSQQLGLGLGPSPNLTDDYSNVGLQARGLSAQQQQQLLLQQFKGNPNSGNLVNSFQGNQQTQLSQGHLTSTAPNHARQTSKFSFANDSGTASTSVKPVPNQKFMSQQSAMMPQSTNHFNQSSVPQGMASNQFYTSSVQGPPPGLKTTGTPPVSGGGMFGQGHGFATGGLGYGANAAGRNNNNEELMRQLLRSQRSDGQGTEAGKRKEVFDFGNSVSHSRNLSNEDDPFSSAAALPSDIFLSRRGTPTIPPGFEGSIGSKPTSRAGTPRIMTPIKPALPLLFPLLKRTATPDIVGESKTQVEEAPPSRAAEEKEKSVPSMEGKAAKDVIAIPSAGSDKPKSGASSQKKDSQATGKKKAKEVFVPLSEVTSSTFTPATSRNVSGATSQPPHQTPRKESLTSKDDTVKKSEVASAEPKSTKKQGSSNKRQAPGKLDISAATASNDEKKKPLKPVTASVPSTPATASTGSPVKKVASKVIRLVRTPKAETPPPLSATSASSAVPPPLATGRLRSRQASIASVNMPGTPHSNDISDAASITSTSLSRANSPPPHGSKSKSAMKTKTKNQAKKERQERHKQQTAEKIEEVVAVDDVVHEPILGRKKKTKKPAKTPTLPTAQADSQPASPVPKAPESKKQKPTPAPKQEVRPPTPPAKVSPVEEMFSEEQHSRNNTVNPSSILAQMLPDIVNSAFFKAATALFPKGDMTAADLVNLERRIPFTQSDLEKIAKGIPVHLGGDDARASSRCVVTSDGLLWGMPVDVEDKYLDLNQRIRETNGPTKYRHISKRAQHYETNNTTKKPTPTTLPSFSTALRNASAANHKPSSAFAPYDDSLRRPYVDDAASYVNQWVIPTEPAQSATNRNHDNNPLPPNPNAHTTAGVPGSSLPLEESLDLLDGYIVRAPAPTTRGSSRVGEEALAALMSGDTDAIAAAGLKMAQSYEEMEKHFTESRKETDRLEKSVNGLLKKNRKFLAGGH